MFPQVVPRVFLGIAEPLRRGDTPGTQISGELARPHAHQRLNPFISFRFRCISTRQCAQLAPESRFLILGRPPRGDGSMGLSYSVNMGRFRNNSQFFIRANTSLGTVATNLAEAPRRSRPPHALRWTGENSLCASWREDRDPSNLSKVLSGKRKAGRSLLFACRRLARQPRCTYPDIR